jgi:hypothetical protein
MRPNTANRSSRDVPTRSFARTCAGGAGRAATGKRRRELAVRQVGIGSNEYPYRDGTSG